MSEAPEPLVKRTVEVRFEVRFSISILSREQPSTKMKMPAELTGDKMEQDPESVELHT
jgi:hypothetical protein